MYHWHLRRTTSRSRHRRILGVDGLELSCQIIDPMRLGVGLDQSASMVISLDVGKARGPELVALLIDSDVVKKNRKPVVDVVHQRIFIFKYLVPLHFKMCGKVTKSEQAESEKSQRIFCLSFPREFVEVFVTPVMGREHKCPARLQDAKDLGEY